MYSICSMYVMKNFNHIWIICDIYRSSTVSPLTSSLFRSPRNPKDKSFCRNGIRTCCLFTFSSSLTRCATSSQEFLFSNSIKPNRRSRRYNAVNRSILAAFVNIKWKFLPQNGVLQHSNITFTPLSASQARRISFDL